MRLKYEKKRLITKINTQKKTNLSKSSSIDNIIFPSKTKTLYLNNIPQKNIINSTKLALEKTYLKNNHPNFQLNNQSNINLRNPNSNYLDSYNSIQRKTYEILDNSYLKNYYISRLREKPPNIKKIFNNSMPKLHMNNIEFIKVNKLNNIYKDEADTDLPKTQRQFLNINNIGNINNNIKTKNINDFDNMFNKNIRLLKPSKKNINLNFIDTNKQKKYIQKKIRNLYDDEYENEENIILDSDNNQIYFDNFINNSARYEFPSDYNNESYLEKFKNNLGKSNNYSSNNSNNYISNGINYKTLNKNKTNNNIIKYTNDLNLNKKNQLKYFNNLKITKCKLSINSSNKKGIMIYNEENEKTKNNLKDNINIIEKSEENNNIIEEYNKLKEKINSIVEENQILKENNHKLIEEINNIKNGISIYNNNTMQKEIKDENQNLIENYKNEINKLKEENDKIIKEKDSLLIENKSIQEQNIKIKDQFDNIKKGNEIKDEQYKLMSQELLILKEEINEEFKISKINLEKLNEDFIALKKENLKYKENLELLEEEKEIESNQKLKLQEENKALKLEQMQLNEQIEFLQEENEELENTATIQDEYNQLFEEFNKILEEKNKIKEELDILKSKNKKEEITFPEPTIIKRSETRRPSKFKKDKNLFFSDNKEDNENKEIKEEVNEKNIFDEIKYKSLRVKNMAELLENHLLQKELQEDEEDNKQNVEEEESPFDNMIKLLQNKEGKIITKKKMSKIIFED